MEELSQNKKDKLRELLKKELAYLESDDPDTFSLIAAINQVLGESC